MNNTNPIVYFDKDFTKHTLNIEYDEEKDIYYADGSEDVLPAFLLIKDLLKEDDKIDEELKEYYTSLFLMVEKYNKKLSNVYYKEREKQKESIEDLLEILTDINSIFYYYTADKTNCFAILGDCDYIDIITKYNDPKVFVLAMELGLTLYCIDDIQVNGDYYIYDKTYYKIYDSDEIEDAVDEWIDSYIDEMLGSVPKEYSYLVNYFDYDGYRHDVKVESGWGVLGEILTEMSFNGNWYVIFKD